MLIKDALVESVEAIKDDPKRDIMVVCCNLAKKAFNQSTVPKKYDAILEEILCNNHVEKAIRCLLD